jgi:hypothetical protein
VGISGLTNSANLQAGTIAAVNDGGFIGGVTPLVGITVDDIRWSFANNSNLENSVVAANPYLDPLASPVTVTIAAPATFVKINQGSWLSSLSKKLSVSVDGDVTNISEIPLQLDCNGFVTMQKVGGGSDRLAARIVLNDLPNDPASVLTENFTQNSQPTSVPLVGLFTLQPGDSISLYVANLNGIADIEVDNARFINFRLFQ